MDAPRDDLTRSVPFEFERGTNGDGLTLHGYAATFDTPTRIDSWEGKFDEQLKRGAFRRSINAGKMPKLQFNHGKDASKGENPIGVITSLREDKIGLHVEARLGKNKDVEPIREMIEMGAIDGMSFRFQVIQDEWDDSGDVPLRTLKEVRLMELGPVVFPAYETTSVGVRSLLDLSILRTLDDDERSALAAELRSLIGTSAPAEPATHAEDPLPESTPGLTPGERARVLRDLELQELFT